MNVKSKFINLINSQKFLSYLIALVLSTLLLGYGINSIALGVLTFFSIRFFLIHKHKIEIEFILVIPILLYLLFSATILWSVHQSKTIIGLERTFSLFLTPIIFCIIPKFSKENYSIVFKYFTITNLLLGIFFLATAFFRFFESYNLEVFKYHDFVSVLELNAIYVSLIFSISLFYLISKKDKTLNDRIKIFLFLFFLILLSSKIMMLTLLISIFVYIFYKKTFKFSKKKINIISTISLLIVGLGSITLTERLLFEKDAKFNEILTYKKFDRIYPWTGSSIRLLQLRILKEQIEEESIFWKGFGLFASRENIKKRHLKFNTYPGFHSYNYHNQYAQILSESGIFGLMLILVMLTMIFIKALKTQDFLFIMFCIVFISMFFTESLLWRQKGLFLFIILYCFLSRVRFEKINKIESSGEHSID